MPTNEIYQPTVEVSSGGEQHTPLFFSDYRLRFGGAEEDVGDGGKWSIGPSVDSLTSVINAPAQWPSHKCLRIDHLTQEGMIITATTYEIPIGTVRNYRWMFAMREPDNLIDAHQHSVQDGGATGAQNWGLYHMSRADGGHMGTLSPGEWGCYWSVRVGGTGERYYFGDHTGNNVVSLPKFIPIRFEAQVIRLSTTQFRFHGWIYDHTGTLLADDTGVTLLSNPGVTLVGRTFTFQNAPNTNKWVCGNQGISVGRTDGSTHYPVSHADEGCWAIVENLEESQPIGPYGSCIGEVVR